MPGYTITIERAFKQPVEDALTQAGCIIMDSSAPDRFSTALWEISFNTELDEASIETLVLQANRGSYFDIAEGDLEEPEYEDDEESEDLGDEDFDDESHYPEDEYDDDWDLHPYYPA